MDGKDDVAHLDASGATIALPVCHAPGRDQPPSGFRGAPLGDGGGAINDGSAVYPIVAIEGSSASDLWIVWNDEQGVGTLQHYDGAAWTAVAHGGGTQTFGAARVLAAGDAWFAGDRSVFHWDGKTVSELPTGLAADVKIRGIMGRAATDLRFLASSGRVIVRR